MTPRGGSPAHVDARQLPRVRPVQYAHHVVVVVVVRSETNASASATIATITVTSTTAAATGPVTAGSSILSAWLAAPPRRRFSRGEAVDILLNGAPQRVVGRERKVTEDRARHR